MTDEAARWFIGIEITVAVAMATALLAAFYRLSDAIRHGDDALHTRINAVRDEYVRRADLENHMSRIDGAMHDMRVEIKDQHRDIQARLDNVLTALTALKQPIPPH